MTTDLTDLIRRYAVADRENDVGDVLTEAADEIERLGRALANAEIRVHDQNGEIDRLRVIGAALLSVVCRLVEWEDGDTHLPISFLTDLMSDARRMAAVAGGES